MQAKARAGRTVVLRLRFGDYTKAARSRTLRWATRRRARHRRRRARAAGCRDAIIERRGITLIGLAVTNLDHAIGPEQLPLFVDDAPVAA